MTSIPAGQRLWKCPDCGAEVLLPITKLDPLACDACLAKLKGGGQKASAVGAGLISPEIRRLIVVGLMTLGLGMVVGFIAGRWTASPNEIARPTRSDEGAVESSSAHKAAVADDGPDESTRPGSNYKWVRGYTRKDGVKVKGHWSRDPNYVAPVTKPKKR